MAPYGASRPPAPAAPGGRESRCPPPGGAGLRAIRSRGRARPSGPCRRRRAAPRPPRRPRPRASGTGWCTARAGPRRQRAPVSASRASRACSTAASLVAVSPDRSAGRTTTAAPARRAAAAIAGSSVDTATSVTSRARRQACTARATSGTPPTGARFLPGTPLEPPRAGMTARTVLRPPAFTAPPACGPAAPHAGRRAGTPRGPSRGRRPAAPGAPPRLRRVAGGLQAVAAQDARQVAGGRGRGVVGGEGRRRAALQELLDPGAGRGERVGARCGPQALVGEPVRVGLRLLSRVEPVPGGEQAGAGEVVVAEGFAYAQVAEHRRRHTPVQGLHGGRGRHGDQQVGAVEDLAHVPVHEAQVGRQRKGAGEPLVRQLLDVRGVLAGLGAQLQQHLAARVQPGVPGEPAQQVEPLRPGRRHGRLRGEHHRVPPGTGRYGVPPRNGRAASTTGDASAPTPSHTRRNRRASKGSWRGRRPRRAAAAGRR